MDVSNLDESKIGQLSALIKRVYAEDQRYMLFEGEPNDAYLRDMLMAKISLLKNGGAIDLVALESGMVIGECEVILGPDMMSGKMGILIDRDFRRYGVGRKLVGISLEKARDMGVNSIYAEVDLQNDNASFFFRNIGFESIGMKLVNGREANLLIKRI